VEPGAESGQIMVGDRPFRPVYRALWDPDYRVREIGTKGVDVQIVCATPIMFGYAWEASKAADLGPRRMNEKADRLLAPVIRSA